MWKYKFINEKYETPYMVEKWPELLELMRKKSKSFKVKCKDWRWKSLKSGHEEAPNPEISIMRTGVYIEMG